MKITAESLSAITKLQGDELLGLQKQGDEASFSPVKKSELSWGRRFLSFLGIGPSYKLSSITDIFRGMLKTPTENATVTDAVIDKLNTRIRSYNTQGPRKYFDFLKIEELSRQQVGLHNLPNEHAKMTAADKELMRIIQQNPVTKDTEMTLAEIQWIASKVTECLKDDTIQRGYYQDKAHPGEGMLEIRDIMDKFATEVPPGKKYFDTHLNKALMYMLLTGQIHSIATGRSGTYIGTDASKTVDNKTFSFDYSEFYNKSNLLEIDRFIKDNTIKIPSDAPAEIKPLVDHIASNINKQLFNIARRKTTDEPVLSNNDLYKICGEDLKIADSSKWHPRAKEAMEFLVKNGSIHAWNSHSHQGYYIQFKESDKIPQNIAFSSKTWNRV